MSGDSSGPCRSGRVPAHPPGHSSSLIIARISYLHPRIGSAAPTGHFAVTCTLKPWAEIVFCLPLDCQLTEGSPSAWPFATCPARMRTWEMHVEPNSPEVNHLSLWSGTVSALGVFIANAEPGAGRGVCPSWYLLTNEHVNYS